MRILNKTFVNIFDTKPTFPRFVALVSLLLGVCLGLFPMIGMFIAWQLDWVVVRLGIVGLALLTIAYTLWPSEIDD